MRTFLLLSLGFTLGLAACGPADETRRAVASAAPDGVEINISAQDTLDEYHLVVRDTRAPGATYVEEEKMDARARGWCEERGMAMAVVSRGKSYMKDDLATDLWFSCTPTAPTITVPQPGPQPESEPRPMIAD